MDKRPRRDFLSALPLSIIHSILALVPIRDAVKTSILSKQWRYIWATLPDLVFDDECASDETSLNHFISQALLLHRGSIHKFELSSKCCINQWLRFLSRNDIRVLILNAEYDDADGYFGFRIHSSLYSCEKLIQLKLFNCNIPPPPPTFNGFLCLRILVLTQEELPLPCEAIESIVANSPLLEELIIHEYSQSIDLRIHAPNLKCLEVFGVYLTFLCAPLLSKLAIFPTKSIHLEQFSSVCNYINFLGGSTNIEELKGGCCFVKYLSIGIESYHRALVFLHLRAIALSSVSFNDMKEIRVILRLIMGAPNLHELHICSITDQQKQSEAESLWDSEGAPSFTFEHLRVIEMHNVFGGLHEIKFIEFLLQSSPVLETMIYKPSPRIKDRRLLTLMAELLRCSRASAKAKVFV